MRSLRFLSLLALCLLQACAHSPVSRYYLLQASGPLQPGERCHAGRIGLGDVQLPVYLDALPLARRQGALLQRDDYQRWAEPLADGVQRVMLANLAERLPGCSLVQPPWTRAGQPDWKLSLQLLQLEAVDDGHVELQARWALLDNAGKPQQQQAVRYARPLSAAVSGDGRYAAIATAHSELLGQLADDISAAVLALPARP